MLVGESLDPIKDRDQANKTNFMGTDFPTVTADDIGMQVVIIKTENNILYRQVWRLVGYDGNQPEWLLERDLNKGVVYSSTTSDVDITDYQPQNNLLTSLSSQTAGSGQTNANKFPYLSADNTFSLAPITATARSLLAASTAADARSVLGLGSLATKSSIAASDIGNVLTISNLANATPNTVINFNASGVPTLATMPSGIPVGTIVMWSSTVLPSDGTWIFCYGQQLSKSEYADLWTYASGSNNIVANQSDWENNRRGSFLEVNTTTFKVPDLRNYFIRAWDGPVGPTRNIGNVQGDAIRNITGWAQNYANGTGAKMSYSGAMTVETVADIKGESEDYQGHSVRYTFDASRVVPTANENRPKNIVLPFIMKAKTLPT